MFPPVWDNFNCRRKKVPLLLGIITRSIQISSLSKVDVESDKRTREHNNLESAGKMENFSSLMCFASLSEKKVRKREVKTRGARETV